MITSASIKARLKKLAVQEGKQYDYLLTLYISERFLYRLSVSEHADKFVLKGGLLLYTIWVRIIGIIPQFFKEIR